jgi:hypothetical protein
MVSHARLAILLSIHVCGSSCSVRSDSEIVNHCPGAPPDIESCFVGDFFADCGGDGDATLACHDSDCLWFSTGCVASGYEASDCDPNDICCHADPNVEGWTWPYSNSEYWRLYFEFYGLGIVPWDRAREANLTVVVDGTLSAPITTVSCNQPAPIPGFDACVGGMFYQVLLRDTITITGYARPPQFYGWVPWIELIPDVDGSLTARMCAYRFTDSLPTNCPDKMALCAEAGSVIVNSWPTDQQQADGIAVRVDAVFPGGFRYQADINLAAR